MTRNALLKRAAPSRHIFNPSDMGHHEIRRMDSNGVDAAAVKWIEAWKQAIVQALPDHVGGGQFLQSCYHYLRENPKLMRCSDALPGAILKVAETGLQLGERVYMIPYGRDISVQIDYAGLVDLAMRSGQLKDIAAHEIHEHDYFEFEMGTSPSVAHKPPPFPQGRGAVIGYYAVARLISGGILAPAPWTVEKMRAHRKRFSKGQPWTVEFEDRYGRKSVLREICRLLPRSTALSHAFHADGRTFTASDAPMDIALPDVPQDAPQELPETVDVPPSDAPPPVDWDPRDEG